ncbi:MAG: hypothetical protein JWP69_74 [Flaviaesturariibacter sp.]|nr:hypothetical protein [Flaviaesturariibacter sp.]
MAFCFAGKFQFLSFAPRSRAAVARRAHNPKVLGSIPSFATTELPHWKLFLFLNHDLGGLRRLGREVVSYKATLIVCCSSSLVKRRILLYVW